MLEWCSDYDRLAFPFDEELSGVSLRDGYDPSYRRAHLGRLSAPVGEARRQTAGRSAPTDLRAARSG